MVDDTIKTLNTFGVKNEDIMICGSVALDICGLFPNYRANGHDVDVVIKCTSDMEYKIKNFIKMLDDLDKNSTKKKSESSTIVLTLKSGTIINLWFIKPTDTFNTEMKLESGVWVERPVDCFNKKKSYGRVKDFQDLNDIAKSYLL
ncbi:MAG: hypothetical protein NC548_26005 [Lachnospiraceae bacterium]|nr:hypothetical protein [Lachnospiraceae bacterium]